MTSLGAHQVTLLAPALIMTGSAVPMHHISEIRGILSLTHSSEIAVTLVEVPPNTNFSALLELLEQTYGNKRILEYQEFDGQVVRVDDALRWERFCAVADDR